MYNKMKNNFFSKFISYLIENVDSVENVNRFIVYKIVFCEFN